MAPHVSPSPCLIIKVFCHIGYSFWLGYGIAVTVTGVKPVIYINLYFKFLNFISLIFFSQKGHQGHQGQSLVSLSLYYYYICDKDDLDDNLLRPLKRGPGGNIGQTKSDAKSRDIKFCEIAWYGFLRNRAISVQTIIWLAITTFKIVTAS